MRQIKQSAYRSCSAKCPVSVTFEGGEVTKFVGNYEVHQFKGFIRPKERVLEGAHKWRHGVGKMPGELKNTGAA